MDYQELPEYTRTSLQPSSVHRVSICYNLEGDRKLSTDVQWRSHWLLTGCWQTDEEGWRGDGTERTLEVAKCFIFLFVQVNKEINVSLYLSQMIPNKHLRGKITVFCLNHKLIPNFEKLFFIYLFIYLLFFTPLNQFWPLWFRWLKNPDNLPVNCQINPRMSSQIISSHTSAGNRSFVTVSIRQISFKT